MYSKESAVMTKIITRTRKEAFNHWLSALESDEYYQTTDVLRSVVQRIDGEPTLAFCCLGVLCDLVAKDGGPQWEDDVFMDHYDTQLPPAIRDDMGLTDHDCEALIDMNDGHDASFKQIAEYIRKEVMPAALERP